MKPAITPPIPTLSALKRHIEPCFMRLTFIKLWTEFDMCNKTSIAIIKPTLCLVIPSSITTHNKLHLFRSSPSITSTFMPGWLSLLSHISSDSRWHFPALLFMMRCDIWHGFKRYALRKCEFLFKRVRCSYISRNY